MFLKITGAIALFLGIMMAIGGAGSMVMVSKGSGDELVKEYLTQNNLTFNQLLGSALVSCVAGIIYLAAGIIGLKDSADVKKANICIVMAVLLFVEIGMEVAYNISLDKFQPYTVVSMAVVPFFYLLGAIRNKQAQGKLL